jgi:hypothetical protein
MPCPGSIVLEAHYPNVSSRYAAEGTAVHDVAAQVLKDEVRDAMAYVGCTFEIEGHKIIFTELMAHHTNEYVEKMREIAANTGAIDMAIEQRVDFSHFAGETDQSGTADVLMFWENAIGVYDLKYGAGVAVSPEENPQLMIYGLGALLDAEAVGFTPERVKLGIYQPRNGGFSEWDIDTLELRMFGREVGLAAAKVREAEQADDIERYLVPGEKQCRFCRARASCPALRDDVALTVQGAITMPLTADDFDDLTAVEVTTETSEDYLGIAMQKAGMIEAWLKAVRAEVERRLLQGVPVKGFKLVEGKRGARAWISSDEATDFLTSILGDEAYEKSLLSPTKAEKLLKPHGVHQHLAGLTKQAQGKTSVAPSTDKRTEWRGSVDDFDNLEETEE